MELETATKIALQYALMVYGMKQTEGPIICGPYFWIYRQLINEIPQTYLQLISQIHRHVPHAIASGEILASRMARLET